MMAKRKKPRRQGMAKKKVVRRKSVRAKVDTKSLVDGLIAGIAPGLAQKFVGNILGGFTTAASYGAIGYFRKNNTLMTMAGVEAAKAFAGGAMGSVLGGNGNGNGNGFFEG